MVFLKYGREYRFDILIIIMCGWVLYYPPAGDEARMLEDWGAGHGGGGEWDREMRGHGKRSATDE